MDWPWHRHLLRQFRFVLIIGLTLLLLVGGMPYFIPIPALQHAFSHAINKSTARTLQVDKGAYFVLLPHPAILLKKVTLSEQNSQQAFLRADRLKLKLDLWPFISGDMHAEIEDIVFKNAQFNLIRNEDMSYNFDNLFNANSDTALLKLSLKSINFYRSHVNVIDQASNSTLSLVDLDMRLNALQNPKHGKLKLSGRLALNAQQAWKGKIEGKAALRLDRKKRLLHIADLDIKVIQNYDYTTPEGWTTSLLNINGNLHYGWQPLRLSGGNLTLKSRAERAEQLWQTQVTIPQFNIADGMLFIDHSEIENTITKKDTVLTSRTEIHNLVGTQHNLALHTNDAHIHIQLKQPSQTLQLYLESALNITGNHSIELPLFHLTGYYRNQSLPRGTLTFSQQGQANMNFKKEKLSFKSKGLLDKAPMSIDFSLRNFLIPRYHFTLGLDRLDLTPYLPAAIEGAKLLTDSEQENDFSWLNGLKARGNIWINTLKLHRVQMHQVQLGMSANKNIFTVSPLSASVYKGNLTGELTINTQGKTPQIRLKQRFSNVEMYPVFNDLFKLTRFGGRGYLNMDIAAAGYTRSDWQRTLGGAMDIGLARGTFKGLDIFTQLRNTTRQLDQLTTKASSTLSHAENSRTATNFSNLRATLFIQKGVVYNKDLRIKAGRLNLTGEGSYDIVADALDYTVNANVAPHGNSKELRKLSGYTLPIYFTGNLQSPKYQLDYSYLRQQIENQHNTQDASTPSAREK
jgi:hypothetical protein